VWKEPEAVSGVTYSRGGAGMNKLLVIDDQPQVLEMVSHFLDSAGYNVVTAQNGQEGLDLARHWRPDLILCDIMMPGMSGYDVLAGTREDVDLATTPFIFLTAKASREDRREGMTRGADDYLTKPFSADELLDTVKAQIEKHAVFQERYQQKINLLRQGLSTILPHELRTPLTLILAHTSMLMEAGADLDRNDVLDMVKVVHDSGLRLHRLLENMLMYVVMEGDTHLPLEQPVTPSARPVIADAATSRAEEANRSRDIHLSLVDGCLHIHPFHLRKMVDELLDNAFKFSTAGQRVRLEVRNDGGHFDLRVEDRGRGMSEQQIENIDVYVQFNRYVFEQQGAGMGLFVVKRLVELYHGTMKIQSQAGRGTMVHVRIPNVWETSACEEKKENVTAGLPARSSSAGRIPPI
jgi:two-component system, sensor histidine kinase and response regulator